MTVRHGYSLFSNWGSCGGDTRVSMLNHVASKEAGFNLSTAMFYGNILNFRFKMFFVSFEDLERSSVAGCKDWVLATAHTKTCVRVYRSLSTYVCAGKLYAKFAILAVSQSTNEVMFKSFCRG